MIGTAARRRAHVAALGAMLALGAAGCSRGDGSGTTAPPTPPPPPPPPVVLDPSGWVTTQPGAMPLVLVAPHGGDIIPADLPDRSCAECVTANDANTMALAYAIAEAFNARIGRRPHLVINRLHRRKFDGNRDRLEATGGHAPLDTMWGYWRARIEDAKVAATVGHPRALLIDLHGHAHAVARLEIGYLLTGAQLRGTDDAVSALLGTTSIARLDVVGSAGVRGAALVRGPTSLGSRIVAQGYPAVPSAVDPAPLAGQDYFNGGFNTLAHGSRDGGAVDAIQVEHHFAGVRDTPENRAAYANALVTALLAYFADHYGWVPPA